MILPRHVYHSIFNQTVTDEEIEDIIRTGDLDSLRQLSRYYYRTNSEYRENIDFLAIL